ncbi:MAG: hypothetical protein J7K31_01430 [Candidatus Aenigmarchaeota archaeon]|nr:hypothetical protein [Candidatus Aenigmarchaeota archaeon]
MFDEKTKHGMLVGAFVGVAVLSLLIPIFLSLGLTRFTSLFLYYSIPVTGAITGYVLSGQGNLIKHILPAETNEKIIEKPQKEQKEDADSTANLTGKEVVIRTTDGETIRGRLRTVGSTFLYLDDLSDKTKHLFIDKNKIKEIGPA